jgi:sugar phosphate isomerase/epimerase
VDVGLIEEAEALYKSEFFSYIELYIIPGSYKETINTWKERNIPFVIHAPHSAHGVNLAQADKWRTNRRNFNEVQLFADTLGSDIIIVHGGNNGKLNETFRQITLLKEQRLVLENKPRIGLDNDVCIGWSPSEFHQANEAGVLRGMALDFGHAACAACSLNINVFEIVEQFMAFNPKIFHISDGDTFSEKDMHLNLGQGNFDIRKFLTFVDERGLVTIETPRNSFSSLEDFIKDVHFLRNL